MTWIIIIIIIVIIYSFDKRLTDRNPDISTSHVIVNKNNSKIESSSKSKLM